MAGYTRTDVADQISNGSTIDAQPLDMEFEALQNAFATVGGHSHDGTVGQGAPITTLGPTKNVIASANSLSPAADNVTNLGTSTKQFRDLWARGTSTLDRLVSGLVTLTGGTIDGVNIGSTVRGTVKATTVTADSFVGAFTGTIDGNLTGDVTGNASTATTLRTPRTIALGGGVTGSGSFDGSSDITITTAVTNNSHSHTLANISDSGTMAPQNSNAVNITGGSVSGITDLAVSDGGTGASSASSARSNLGLGSIATQNSNSVTITGGSISGITDLAVSDGGTGASSASSARANLGFSGSIDQINALGGNAPEMTNLDTTTGTGVFRFRGTTPGTLPFIGGDYIATLWQADVLGQTTQLASVNIDYPLFLRVKDDTSFGPWLAVITDKDKASKSVAEAGVDNSTYMTPLQTNNAIVAQAALAPVQSWQTVTRTQNVEYTNFTGAEITLAVFGQPRRASTTISFEIDSLSITTSSSAGDGASVVGAQINVPAGSTYRWRASGDPISGSGMISVNAREKR